MKAFKRDDNEYIIMSLESINNPVCCGFKYYDITVFEKYNIPVLKELQGYYKGEIERSYLVPMSVEALQLAEKFNQESVLVLHPMENGKRYARLMYLNNMFIETGKKEFKNVGKNKPDTDAWTYDIETKDYYILK